MLLQLDVCNCLTQSLKTCLSASVKASVQTLFVFRTSWYLVLLTKCPLNTVLIPRLRSNRRVGLVSAAAVAMGKSFGEFLKSESNICYASMKSGHDINSNRLEKRTDGEEEKKKQKDEEKLKKNNEKKKEKNKN